MAEVLAIVGSAFLVVGRMQATTTALRDWMKSLDEKVESHEKDITIIKTELGIKGDG